MKYNRPRRNRFRNNDRGFKRNNSQDMRNIGSGSSLSGHQRKPFGRNGHNAEKLLEKYNNLAKEASSNGDKILSESYYQYADHFLRVIEHKNSIQNNSKSNSESSSTEGNSENKIALDDDKISSPPQSQNNKEI